MGGSALADYALGVLFVLACAAGGASLFTLALSSGQDGSLRPLLTKFAGNGSAERKTLCMMVHDMSRGETVSDEAKEDGSKDPFVKAVRAKLDDAFDVKQRNAPHDQSSVHVAAFRSPDKAAFADVFIFVGADPFFGFHLGLAHHRACFH